MKQVHLNITDLSHMEKRKKTNLINSLGGFKSANLIGTKSKEGQTNLSIVSSVFHVGADPALMGFIIRPDVSPRHTLENIRETGFLTINHVNSSIAKAAHQTSARYPKESSEFDACGLKEEYLENFHAPYVHESLIKIGLRLSSEKLIEENNTHMIVAKVEHVFFNEEVWQEDGTLEIEKASSLVVRGLDTYFEVGKLRRFSYAKPDKELEELL